jgi:hypothetical protein
MIYMTEAEARELAKQDRHWVAHDCGDGRWIVWDCVSDHRVEFQSIDPLEDYYPCH